MSAPAFPSPELELPTLVPNLVNKLEKYDLHHFMRVNSIKYGGVEVLPRCQEYQSQNKQTLLFLPNNDDDRLRFFGISDPCPRTKKSIVVNDLVEYEAEENVFLVQVNDKEEEKTAHPTTFFGKFDLELVLLDVRNIHAFLVPLQDNKSMDDELPEQLLIYSFLQAILMHYGSHGPHEDNEYGQSIRMLELGGNAGRATLMTRMTLMSLFGVDSPRPRIRHVVLESFPSIATELRRNLRANQVLQDVAVDDVTLNDASKFGMVQTDWVIDSFDLSDRLQAANFQTRLKYASDPNNKHRISEVGSMTYQEIKSKHFEESPVEVWIVDCEGFFASVCRQFPEVLEKDAQVILLENDFVSWADQRFVDDELQKNGFYSLFSLPGGLPKHLARHRFYQIWVRRGSPMDLQLQYNATFHLHRVPGFEFVQGIENSLNLEKKQEQMIHENESNDNGVFHRVVEEILFSEHGEVDAAPVVDHDFLMYSIVGCKNCDHFMEDARNAKDEDAAAQLSIAVRKVDVTKIVRSGPEGKRRFAAYITEKYGFQGYNFDENADPADQRLFFPIIIYNNKYLGNAVKASTKLQTIVENGTE